MPTIITNNPDILQPDKNITNQNRIREFVMRTLGQIGQLYKSGNNPVAEAKSIEFVNNLLKLFFAEPDKVGPLDRVIRRNSAGLFYFVGSVAKAHYEPYIDKTTMQVKQHTIYKDADAMPLMFIVQVDSKGFYGVNFHVLNPYARVIILNRLILRYPEQFFEGRQLMPISINSFFSLLGQKKRLLQGAFTFYPWKKLKSVRGIRICRVPNNMIIDAIQLTAPLLIGMTYKQLVTEWRRLSI
jgi:hypothetical protein